MYHARLNTVLSRSAGSATFAGAPRNPSYDSISTHSTFDVPPHTSSFASRCRQQYSSWSEACAGESAGGARCFRTYTHCLYCEAQWLEVSLTGVQANASLSDGTDEDSDVFNFGAPYRKYFGGNIGGGNRSDSIRRF